MIITMNAEVLILEQAVMQKVMAAFVQQEMKQAVRKFLRAAVRLIPIDTGFLRGSFQSLTSFYNVPGSFGGSNPLNKKYYNGRGSGIVKSTVSGIPFVTKPEDLIRRLDDGNVVFSLDNQIRYFAVNDFGSAIPSAPWGATTAGLEAMEDYLRGSAKRFPAIDLLLTKVRITAGNGSSSETREQPSVDSIIATRELLIG